MALTAMWVHGTAFAPAESPANGLVNVGGAGWSDVLGLRQGWGITFQGQAGHSNIFHVAIPTPVIVNDVRAKLKKVFVLFNCRDANDRPGGPDIGANITQIDVWDGSTLIKTFGGFKLFGSHLRLDGSNFGQTFTNPPEVSWGLGLSVSVKFNSDNSLVTFGSAGADFDI